MPSLTQLLTSHHRLLLLDAASMKVQVGWLREEAPALWHCAAQEAGTGIFAGVDTVLKSSGSRLDEVGAFVFCEGPGSMLGIRTVAMALRTWQVLQARPVYAYQSLTVAAAHEWTLRRREFAVVADARRESWHCQVVSADGQMPSLQRLAPAALPAGELATPEDFRAWTSAPRPFLTCSYDLARIFSAIPHHDCFRPVAEPDAYQSEAPLYRKWSAKIHQAPSNPAA